MPDLVPPDSTQIARLCKGVFAVTEGAYMAFTPLEPVRRQLRSLRFRGTSDFHDAVEAAVSLAHSQTFCSPVDYARSRANNGFASARDVTTWKAVHERLLTTPPEVESGWQGAPADKGQRIEPSEASTPSTSECQKFAVTLKTPVGPGSAAAALAAMADNGVAVVAVEVVSGEPTLVYMVPKSLVVPSLKELAFSDTSQHA